MVISDALPIQFWYNGTPTYNEYDPGRPFDHILFYQEFLNTDNQIVQLRDTTGLSYYLQFLDCDGVETDLLPMSEIASGVYEVVFNPGDMGIVNEKRQLKIQKGVVVGSIVTEDQISIDEFVSDMESWVNKSSPTNVLQPTTSYSQIVNSTTPGGLGSTWYGSTPEQILGPGEVSYWAYIDLSGSNGYEYSISNFIGINSNTDVTVYFDCVFYFLDSGLSVLGSSSFSFGPITVGVPFVNGASPSFIVPAGIGNVKYIALKIINTGPGTPLTNTSYYRWTTSTLAAASIASWAWSSDDSGCLKVTTVNTVNESAVTKSFSLPQENHYIRIKWQIDYPPANSNFTLLFTILNSSMVQLSAQVLTSPSNSSEQTFVQYITSSLYLTAAYLRISIYDSAGSFVSGDIVRVNSVEIYTSVTENVTEFIEMAKSDYLQFSNIIENALYLQYKSYKNFAAIYYTSLSSYFGIRIPAIFQKQKPVTEQKSIDLSNSVVINTASQLKIQKMLKTEDLPDYMHTKIVLILQHAVSGSLIINNVEWTNEEGYEIEEPDQMYILSRGNTLLTRKNYLQSNVI